MAGIFGGAGYSIKKALLTRKVPLKRNDPVLPRLFVLLIISLSNLTKGCLI
jgi:hypothetical protein